MAKLIVTVSATQDTPVKTTGQLVASVAVNGLDAAQAIISGTASYVEGTDTTIDIGTIADGVAAFTVSFLDQSGATLASFTESVTVALVVQTIKVPSTISLAVVA